MAASRNSRRFLRFDGPGRARRSQCGGHVHASPSWPRTGPAESQVTGGDCGHCGSTAYAPYGLSHGCINERHDDAVWLFDWVPAANPAKKVVHLTYDALASEACDHVTGTTTSGTTSSGATNPDQVLDITRDACLAHPTHCLEDLRSASGAIDGRWICWKSGAHSTSGRTCSQGQWH